MARENEQAEVEAGNSIGSQPPNGTKAADTKGKIELAETSFDKFFIRVCLYIVPLLLFFALFDFSNATAVFTGTTGINYIASYSLYIVIIELARKLHADTKKSTHARHVFNQSFVYFPLALFLFTASYALYSAGSEVFGVQPAEQRQAFVQEVDKFLDTYKAQCTQASVTSKEQHQCIEKYLNATLFADVKLIQEKYGDASNSYSIIAIMTGFFGVLMTVLVIYFSLSGRELLDHKLQKSEELMDELKSTMENTKNEVDGAIKKAEDASKKAEDASKKAEEASNFAEKLEAMQKKVQMLQNDLKQKGELTKEPPSDGANTQRQLGEPDQISKPEGELKIHDKIKTFDGRLNITGGESLKEGLEYTLTFYKCQEDFDNKHNPIELQQALVYPFNVNKVDAEVIKRVDEKTILVVSSHSSTSESPATEEVFSFKPSNAPEPDNLDKHK